jgi:DNA-binding protein HU-beta
MQKTEFIEHVAKEANVTKTEADKVVRAVINSITDLMTKGEKLTLTGFGTFEVRERGEREVTHIRTKEKVKVPASKLPSFSAGTELKAAVNGKAPAKTEGAAPAEKKAPKKAAAK